jgi:hypothetical protein
MARATRLACAATVAFAVFALLAEGCGPAKDPNGGATPTPGPTGTPGPGARVLSISADPAHIPSPTIQDFIDAQNLAKSAGCTGTFQSYTWSALETSAGAMNVSKVGTDVSGTIGAGLGAKVYLSIQMINTTAKETPSDLQAVAWDDPAMKARFHALVDAITPLVAGKIQYFGVGNEVDVYLAAQNQWTPFQGFYDDAVTYIHTKLPGVPVGTTFTFGGAQANAAHLATLTANSDVMIFTDYPLGANFVPLAATHGKDDLDAMVAMAGAKPVLVQELGYPADATVLGSSESAQAAFFSDALDEWRAIGGAKMPFLNVFLMHDFSAQMCSDFAAYYGGAGNANFEAYLCSIGLRKNDGTPRAAWNTFVTTAHATGF